MKAAVENEIKCYPLEQSPTIPQGYQLNDIQNEIKSRKNLKDALKSTDNLFEGQTIFIDSNFGGKNFRINIVPESESISSHISKQFLSGEYCLTGVSAT